MTLLVVDASVAVKWFVSENDADKAKSLVGSDQDLICPDLLLIEFATAMSRRTRLAEVPLADAIAFRNRLPIYFSEIVRSQLLIDDAFHLSIALKHPLPDCIYLALAIARGAHLVTADQVFLSALQGTAYASSVKDLAAV
jgi:predicted nucleic acid-binding protein